MKTFSPSHRGRFLNAVVTISLVSLCGSAVCGQSARLSRVDLEKLLQLGIGDDAILAKIKTDGIAFAGDEKILGSLRKAGASQAVLDAVQSSPMPSENPPTTTPPILYDDVLSLLKLGIS